MSLRPRKSVVDVVVAKLPPPDRITKQRGGADSSYEEDDSGDSDMGEESAFSDFVAAMGIKPKDAGEARKALSDYVEMCVRRRMAEVGGEDDEE